LVSASGVQQTSRADMEGQVMESSEDLE